VPLRQSLLMLGMVLFSVISITIIIIYCIIVYFNEKKKGTGKINNQIKS